MLAPSSPDQGQFSFDMEPLKETIFFPQEKKKRRKKIHSPATDKTCFFSETKEENHQSTSFMMTVSQVTKSVARLIEQGLGTLWVEGEISNYRKQSSGHHYFTVKDAYSQLSCVLFSRSAAIIPQLSLADGMMVQLCGEVTVYQPRGQYQLLVRLVQHKGAGVLQAEFEALKQKLAAQGFFDAQRKRLIPRFPRRIAVVTSPTGAALADFLKVLHRRHPGLGVVIYPVRVQGEGAAQQIARAIEELNFLKIGPLDLIVLTRGGGSLEDLWAFNEEIVVRAIVASRLPIVSGVGHEIDITLSDFAADLRAPTPSAAAELISMDSAMMLEHAELLLQHIMRAMSHSLEQVVSKIKMLEQMILFYAPERLFAELGQRLDHIEESLLILTKNYCQEIAFKLKNFSTCLSAQNPKYFLEQAKQRSSTYGKQLHDQVVHYQKIVSVRLENSRSSLAALSPQATLSRGFTITRDEHGKILSSEEEAAQLALGSLIKTEFADEEILVSKIIEQH